MDLIGVLRACVKRWWVFLPLIGLTVWLCTSQYRSAQAEYTTTASVVIAPSDSLVYVRGNQAETGVLVTSPFSAGNGERVLAGVLARAMNTAAVREQLLPAGDVSLLAERDVEADANVVALTVVSSSASAARDGVESAASGADDVLAAVQRDAGVKDGQYYVAVASGPIDRAAVAYPDRVRAVVGFALAGLLLAVVAAVVVQSLFEVRAAGAGRVKVKRPGSGSLTVNGARLARQARPARPPKPARSPRATRPAEQREPAAARGRGSAGSTRKGHARHGEPGPRRSRRGEQPASGERSLDLTGTGPGSRP